MFLYLLLLLITIYICLVWLCFVAFIFYAQLGHRPIYGPGKMQMPRPKTVYNDDGGIGRRSGGAAAEAMVIMMMIFREPITGTATIRYLGQCAKMDVGRLKCLCNQHTISAPSIKSNLNICVFY